MRHSNQQLEQLLKMLKTAVKANDLVLPKNHLKLQVKLDKSITKKGIYHKNYVARQNHIFKIS